MKKTSIIALIVALVAVLLPSMSSAAIPLRVEVNGKRIWFPDAQPFLDKNQRVQVPVRFVSEALGSKVDWNGKTKLITISLKPKLVKLTIGNKVYQVNGQNQQMDTSAMEKGSRTFVPLRFVSQALGAKVVWNSAINTVEITTGDYTQEPKTEGNTIKKQVIHGFTVFENTGSGLVFDKGDEYDKLGKDYPVLDIDLNFKGNYKLQLKEVEEILLQKIDKKTVDAVIKHLSAKTSSNMKLEDLIVENSDYEIYVDQDKIFPNFNYVNVYTKK
ncbi:copper amine oxidase N-terminal domain-containing protein [Paenibacillus sp. SN-8-1]|uniref:copper amine oxidase N-terminal domain-containing protein n=1 Tax=Paenibacillus sp. SN-8-1 TaxID=3435409 RepID=UPI003D9A3E19